MNHVGNIVIHDDLLILSTNSSRLRILIHLFHLCFIDVPQQKEHSAFLICLRTFNHVWKCQRISKAYRNPLDTGFQKFYLIKGFPASIYHFKKDSLSANCPFFCFYYVYQLLPLITEMILRIHIGAVNRFMFSNIKIFQIIPEY